MKRKDVEVALRQLGALTAPMPSWSMFILSPSTQLEHYMNRRADKKRKLFNGRIECNLFQYLGPLPPRRQTDK